MKFDMGNHRNALGYLFRVRPLWATLIAHIWATLKYVYLIVLDKKHQKSQKKRPRQKIMIFCFKFFTLQLKKAEKCLKMSEK